MEEVVRGVASLLNPFTRGDSYPRLIGRLRRSRDRYDKLNASRIHRAVQQRVVQLHFVPCCCPPLNRYRARRARSERRREEPREGRSPPNDKNIDQKLQLVSVQRPLTAPRRLADLRRSASCGCTPRR